MSSVARLFHPVLKLLLYLIYQPLAFTYDWVASAVSLGRWKKWVFTIIPRLHGNVILEIGHGPGHLQRAMALNEYKPYGIDISRQMVKIARRRLEKQSISIRLSRASAEALPFASQRFDTVAMTNPAEYIVSESALSEFHRVLKMDGVLISLLGGWITGTSLFERLFAYITHITGAMPKPDAGFNPLLDRFKHAGFIPEIIWMNLPGSTLLYLRAVKIHPIPKKSTTQ